MFICIWVFEGGGDWGFVGGIGEVWVVVDEEFD